MQKEDFVIERYDLSTIDVICNTGGAMRPPRSTAKRLNAGTL